MVLATGATGVTMLVAGLTSQSVDASPGTWSPSSAGNALRTSAAKQARPAGRTRQKKADRSLPFFRGSSQ